MTVLMLAGAVCFCIFMMLSIDNVLVFKDVKKRIRLLDAFGFIVVVFVITVVSVFELSAPVIHGMVVSLTILLMLLYRSIVKGIAFVIYLKALFFSIDGAALLLLQMLGREAEPVWPATLAVALGTWAAYYFIKSFLKKRIDMHIFSSRIMPLLMVSSGIAVMFIYVNVANVDFANFDRYTSYVLFFFSAIMLVAIVIRYVSKETKVRTKMLLVESSKKYIHDLEESYNALRVVKHDYVNILTTLKLYIDSKDMAGLEKYYYDELAEVSKDLLHQDKLIGDLQNIHINEVKSILIYKCSAATGLGIEVGIEVREIMDTLGVSTTIVCQVLGILLDNAIEATLETGERKLRIAVIRNPCAAVFIIRNTWNEQDIPASRLFELGFSTKADGRGVGLYTVRNYTGRIEKLYLETELTEEYFTQTLTVKDGKESAEHLHL